MTPTEIAMKFSSASATCKNGKCPYISECRGTTETCKLKEVAMVIRSLQGEIATLTAKYNALEGIANEAIQYMINLEKINDHYYKLCKKFQDGYRPKVKIVRKDARLSKKQRPKDPVKMDGDKRYEYKDPNKQEELPVVFI